MPVTASWVTNKGRCGLTKLETMGGRGRYKVQYLNANRNKEEVQLSCKKKMSTVGEELPRCTHTTLGYFGTDNVWRRGGASRDWDTTAGVAKVTTESWPQLPITLPDCQQDGL